MSRPVCITYDSTCDLTPALLERFQIRTVPLTIQSGPTHLSRRRQLHRSGPSMPTYQKDGTPPQNGGGKPEEFKNFFAPILDEGFDIVHIDISSNLSCTCQNALLAATEMEAAHRIHVVDSRQLSTAGPSWPSRVPSSGTRACPLRRSRRSCAVWPLSATPASSWTPCSSCGRAAAAAVSPPWVPMC